MFNRIALLGLLFSVGLSSCASDDAVKEVDTKLDVKTRVDGKEIGVNDDDEAIIQEKTDAGDELRSLEWANTRLMERLETDYNELKRCREDVSDVRLGGSGDVSAIPEIDKMKNLTEVKEEFGMDEDGKLVVVKREKFKDKLTQEKKFQETLKTMQKAISQHRVECERRMRLARVKAGLPAQRYTAQGFFDNNGTWNETRKAEITLDDAFDIKKRETKQAPTQKTAPADSESQDL